MLRHLLFPLLLLLPTLTFANKDTTSFDTCKVTVPTSFTPNGDSMNDRFLVQTNCPLAEFEISIFNRWGQVMYQSDDITEGWDGTTNLKKPAPTGTYFLQIKYKFEGDGYVEVDGYWEALKYEEESIQAHVTLMR